MNPKENKIMWWRAFVLFVSLFMGCTVGGEEGGNSSDSEERGNAQQGDPCSGTIDCTPGSICWNAICVGEGSLRFSLSWSVNTDFDLHVLTPNGNEIYYSNRYSEGGELDVDDCVNGACKSTDGTHVENVFWTDTPSAGTYTYWVKNYDCSQSGSYEIEVAKGGSVVASQSGVLPATCGDSEHYTVITQ